MTNLVETFESLAGDTLIRQLSSHLGESAESITSATKLGSAAIVASLAWRADSNEGVASLLDFMRTEKMDAEHVSMVTGVFQDQQALDALSSKGASILHFLSGDKLNGVIDYLAGHSGLKSSSSSAVLKIVAPVMLSIVGKYILEKSLDRQGVKSLLQYQKPFLENTLPKPLMEALGLNTETKAVSTSIFPGMQASTAAESQTTFSKILPWIVLLLAALGMFYFVEKGCGGGPAAQENPQNISVDSSRLDSI